MRGWSLPVGRLLGVEVRLHAFFILLLGFSVSFGLYSADDSGRGLLLWALLLLAVLVREAARALAAVWLGLEPRRLLLLPTGALPTYGAGEASGPGAARTPEGEVERRMALVGPAANLLFGGITAALVLAVSPEINLAERPWVTPAHLLRALVWTNVLLGAIHLLPAAPLDGARLFRLGSRGGRRVSGASRAANPGQMVAIGLVIAGVLLGSAWFVMMGMFVLLGSHMEDQGTTIQTEVDTITMRDVMLTDYTTLSASDTLEDALERAVHSLQDVFPVVRGGTIVGAVSRQSILDALQAGGNSYVQGVMARTFEVAGPDDALVKTLGRIAGGAGTQFVPVLEGERVIGIVTPHHLSQSIRLRGLLPKRRPNGNGR